MKCFNISCRVLNMNMVWGLLTSALQDGNHDIMAATVTQRIVSSEVRSTGFPRSCSLIGEAFFGGVSEDQTIADQREAVS